MDKQLPANVLEELEAAAQDKYSKMAEHAEDAKDTAYAQGYAEGWHTGATEYATSLHHAKQLLFRLASLVNAEQTPDEKFLTEIKTFLDGTR